jgi:hypothetical protein
MSTCVFPVNQPIYQALIDKANSYPDNMPFQAKAYKKAADGVLAFNGNLYTMIAKDYPIDIPGAGPRIEAFIRDYVESNPLTPEPPVEKFAAQVMQQATKIASLNAPKDVSTWPDDDAVRENFLACVAASNSYITVRDVYANASNQYASVSKMMNDALKILDDATKILDGSEHSDDVKADAERKITLADNIIQEGQQIMNKMNKTITSLEHPDTNNTNDTNQSEVKFKLHPAPVYTSQKPRRSERLRIRRELQLLLNVVFPYTDDTDDTDDDY